MELDKIKQVKLSQVRVNKQNPRTIAKDKFQKLVTSILVFPKMLMIRPIVVDNVMQALGGNMRNNALKYIAKMSPEDIAERLHSSADYQRKTEGERQALLQWWGEWLVYVNQAGGSFYEAGSDNKVCALDSPEALEATEFFVKKSMGDETEKFAPNAVEAAWEEWWEASGFCSSSLRVMRCCRGQRGARQAASAREEVRDGDSTSQRDGFFASGSCPDELHRGRYCSLVGSFCVQISNS